MTIKKTVEKFLRKRIVIVNEKPIVPNGTAALSEYGFWYVGNVFDMADISYGIATQGSVEKEETKLVLKVLMHLAKNQPISVYDIGANTGYYGILSAFLFKERVMVYSFEPVSEHVDCINKSIHLNRLENLKVHACALGKKNEEQTMYVGGSGSTFEKGMIDNAVKEKRKMVLRRLDDMVASEHLILPHFIKMDVEGHELKILEGARNTITKSMPVIFVEVIYSLKRDGRLHINNDYNNTFTFLEHLGYRAYKIHDSTLTAHDSAEKPDGVHMYLFLHTKAHAELTKFLTHEKLN